LYIYPIKSCRGIELDNVTVLATGFTQDRRWMLVNEQGRFLTQRELPQLALIAPTLAGIGLTVHAPGMTPLVVTGTRTQAMSVTVWKDQCRAFDEGEQAADWFTQFLGSAVRLVRFDDTQLRLSSRDWTGELPAANLFSDGFPLLVIGQASLTDLNSRLTRPLPMNRFRPNIVVTGLQAYEEDRVDEFSSGDLCLRAVKPCTRCKITTTDQATGIAQGMEPLSTLMQYRRNAQLRGVTFGQNLIICAGIGQRLHVGETLQVTYKS
jgi:uncharacterized protein YcbX